MCSVQDDKNGISRHILSLDIRQGHKGFSIRYDAREFSIFISEIECIQHDKVIRHSRDSPFLFIGNGKTSFEGKCGNFIIDTYIEARIPLTDFRIMSVWDTAVQIMLCSATGFQVRLRAECTEDTDLILSIDEMRDGFEWLWFRVQSTVTEKLFGGGEQYTHLNLKGRSYPIWTREKGVGRCKSSMLSAFMDFKNPGSAGDYHTTYFPQATFISSRRFSCHVTGHNYKVMNFETDSHTEIFVQGSEKSVRPSILLNSGKSIQEVQIALSKVLGRQPMLPKWVHSGAIMAMQGGSSSVAYTYRQMAKAKIIMAGVWIQDWCGRVETKFGHRVFWNWEWDQEYYPALKDQIEEYNENEVRVLCYINPHLNCTGRLFGEADKKKYLMKRQSGESYTMDFGEFEAGTIDLTNAEAVEWYKDIIKKNIIDFGFSGWMADFGEYIPADGVFHDGRTGLEIHNEYPVLWAKLNREVVEEVGMLGELIFFTRSGGEGTQKYSLLSWAGDQTVTLDNKDGLGTTIPAALSLGLCGFGMTHIDIGGYTGVETYHRDKLVATKFDIELFRRIEVIQRGAKMSIFSPIMRTHEGNLRDSHVQILDEPEMPGAFEKMVYMFRDMQPYRLEVMEENATRGIPMMRPLFYHYESDDGAYNAPYQYLFGRDLLVAPVYEKECRKWKVYLPGPETWISIYDEAEEDQIKGPTTVEMDTPPGIIPVFYRKGSKWDELFTEIGNMMSECEETLRTLEIKDYTSD